MTKDQRWYLFLMLISILIVLSPGQTMLLPKSVYAGLTLVIGLFFVFSKSEEEKKQEEIKKELEEWYKEHEEERLT